MADKKHVHEGDSGEMIIARAKDFWERNNRMIMIIGAAIIILGGGYFGYKYFFQLPKEKKANEAIFKAEEYYRMDSVNLALNGDGQYPGFLSVLKKYSGTDAANLANFYTGSCYLKLGDNNNAVKYLKKFSSDAKQIQARAYKLLGDAYADMGKNSDALDYYKKAGHYFETDENNSAEYLFMAAYLADRVMKNPKEAIELYKEVKQKFPNARISSNNDKGGYTTERASDLADNYLAQLGVYSTE